jgi:hypothetical protein
LQSPSYFASDVRRLRVVSIDELEIRANEEDIDSDSKKAIPLKLQRTAQEKIEFFRKITTCLVLSNVGTSSEAFRMSGGDYGTYEVLAVHKCDKSNITWWSDLYIRRTTHFALQS